MSEESHHRETEINLEPTNEVNNNSENENDKGRDLEEDRRDNRDNRGYYNDRPRTSKTLFVGNIPSKTTEEEVRKIFEAYGNLKRVAICTDAKKKETNYAYAFVEFEDIVNAEEAYNNLKGTKIEDREIKLDYDFGRRGPRRRDYSPRRRRDYSPRRRDYSPRRRRDYSPRRRDYSPRRRDYSPRRNYSPRRDSRDSRDSRDRDFERRAPRYSRGSRYHPYNDRDRSPRRDRGSPRRDRSPPRNRNRSPSRSNSYR
ncbi:hypothetical protein ABK040_001579 [Willaertia magna]